MCAAPLFELTVSSSVNNWVVQAKSLDGQSRQTSQPSPLDLAWFETAPHAIETWVLEFSKMLGYPHSHSPHVQLGNDLYARLFDEEVSLIFDEFVKKYNSKSNRVAIPRFQLRITDELQDVPWEMLRLSSGQFVAWDNRLPFVRLPYKYYDCEETNIAPINGHINVVVVVANPQRAGHATLDIKSHLEALNPIRKSQAEFKIEFFGGYNTYKILQKRLRDPKPIHILHIFCAAEKESDKDAGLVFEDETGRDVLFNPNDLRYLLADRGEQKHNHDIKMIALWTCNNQQNATQRVSFAKLGSDLVCWGYPAIITMQFQPPQYIIDKLIYHFYSELVSNKAIDVAFTCARCTVGAFASIYGLMAAAIFVHPMADLPTLLQKSEVSGTMLSGPKRRILRKKLGESLSLSEVDSLCFDMGITSKVPSDSDLMGKVRLVISELEQHNRLHELYDWINEERPDIELSQ